MVRLLWHSGTYFDSQKDCHELGNQMSVKTSPIITLVLNSSLVKSLSERKICEMYCFSCQALSENRLEHIHPGTQS